MKNHLRKYSNFICTHQRTTDKRVCKEGKQIELKQSERFNRERKITSTRAQKHTMKSVLQILGNKSDSHNAQCMVHRDGFSASRANRGENFVARNEK